MSKIFNRTLLGQKANASASSSKTSYLSTVIDAESGIDGLQNNVFVDSSIAARQMTVYGDCYQGRFSPMNPNWAALFNGTNQYAQVSSTTSDIQLGQVFTIEAFFCLTSNLTYKTSSNTYVGRILNGNVQSSMEFTVGGATSQTPTSISLGRYSATGLITASGLTIPINKWHHVAVTRNAAGVISMFFNGVRVATLTGSTDTVGASAAFCGGVNSANWYCYFPGYLSNIRVVKGNTVYDPTATTIEVPAQNLTAVAGTSLLLFNRPLFENQVSPSTTITYNSPEMVPVSPFSSTDFLGGSGFFDGNGDYLKTPNAIALSPEGQDFCAETFVYFKPGASAICFFNKVEGAYPAGFEWTFNLSGGNTINFSTIQVGGTAVTLSSPANIIGGQWYHVAASRKGSVISLFVNGRRVATRTITVALVTTSAAVTIGKDLETSTNRPLTGYLSNSRFVKGDFVYDPGQTTLTVPTQPLTAIAGTSLLLKYENSGVQDLMGIVNVNTRGNARGQNSIRKRGAGAMYFDGSGDYLEINHADCLNLSRGDFTIRGWINITSMGSTDVVIVDKDELNGVGYASYGLFIRGYDRKLRAYTGPGNTASGTNYVGTTVLNLNQWYHVVFQRTGNTISIYVNGVLDYQGPIGVAPIDRGRALGVGRALGYTAYDFAGYMDSLEIIQGQALYSANFTPE